MTKYLICNLLLALNQMKSIIAGQRGSCLDMRPCNADFSAFRRLSCDAGVQSCFQHYVWKGKSLNS